MVETVTDNSPPTRFAIILTHNRRELLRDCVTAISPQVNRLWVWDNASDPRVERDPRYELCFSPLQPPNLAVLWNDALDEVGRYAKQWSIEHWDVALLCDDVAVPDGWFAAISTCMRVHGAAAGSTHSARPVDLPIVKTLHDGDIYNRMHGAAFVLRGELGLVADETMHWWWCDTDMDWQARLRGGTVICPGPVAINSRPNDFTNTVPGLAERAGRDREAFTAKWGSAPW